MRKVKQKSAALTRQLTCPYNGSLPLVSHVVTVTLNGATENARLELSTPSKCRGGKCGTKQLWNAKTPAGLELSLFQFYVSSYQAIGDSQRSLRRYIVVSEILKY